MKPEEVTLDTEFEKEYSFNISFIEFSKALRQVAAFVRVLERQGVNHFTYQELSQDRCAAIFGCMLSARLAIKIGDSLEFIAQEITNEHYEGDSTHEAIDAYQAKILSQLKELIKDDK